MAIIFLQRLDWDGDLAGVPNTFPGHISETTRLTNARIAFSIYCLAGLPHNHPTPSLSSNRVLRFTVSIFNRLKWVTQLAESATGDFVMRSMKRRITLLLAFGTQCLAATTVSAAAPAPCEVLSAGEWSSIMGYTATATPGDMNCTYEGKGGGGQFRIMAIAGSSAEAVTGAKRLRELGEGNPNAWRGVVESQGPVVFSISLFQKAPTASTASQLQKLVAAAKQHLPK